MITALEIAFWVSAGLLVYTQLGYGVLLWLIAAPMRARARRARSRAGAAVGTVGTAASDAAAAARPTADGAQAGLPRVSLIVAAHDEQEVIAAKVANALALDYPREHLEIIVACDGCADATAERARAAGADLVLELPRGGKVRAQDAAVARASGAIVAFSDANALWEPDALLALVGAFEDARVGYACGQVRYLDAEGAATSQEGVYWRYELALRRLESQLRSITGGNGGIYATRRESYIVVDPIMGHDLAFPYRMVKRGWRAVYVPDALAHEKMVPSIEGEFARKRRMMSHTWPIVVRGGMLSPRGYGPLYYLMIVSHRALRYATPLLHLIAFATNTAAVAAGAGVVLRVTLWLQCAILVASTVGGRLRLRPLLIARHYVLTTAAVALGLWDWLRHGTSAAWKPAEGTR